MTALQKWQLTGILSILALLIYLLAPMLTPFAIAALIGYLGDPLVDRLERRFSRNTAVTLVFTLMVLLLVLVVLILVPLLESQISTLIRNLPSYVDWARERVVPLLQQYAGLSPELFTTDQIVAVIKSHWQQAGGVAATVVEHISKSGLAVVAWVSNLILIPVLTFYFMRDWDGLIARIRELIPRSMVGRVATIARESDEVLGAFLRGQLLVMLALGTIYSLGLWIVGVDLALLIGMGAGLVSFVPYLGGILGVLAALVATLVEHRDWIHVLGVLMVFGIGQTIEGFVLTPMLVGDRIGLHPVAVIFAIMAGGTLFGFLGVLLALPVAAVLMVILRHVHEQYVGSELYSAGTAVAAATVPAANPAAAEPAAVAPGSHPPGSTPPSA